MTGVADSAPFRAARWASGPHAQTVAARVLRSPRGPDFQRERFETPDDDFLDVDWGPDPGPHAPMAIVLHGLEGSSRRRYVLSASRELVALGIRPVAMNFRGCSGEPNRALRFYHSGDTADAAWLLSVLRERYPERPVGALGFSLGGNVLLKLMGERDDGGSGLLDAAAVMSVPYNLAEGSRLLEQSLMGGLYARYFLRSLGKKLEAKRKRLNSTIDIEAARRARTIWAFDEHVTAPLNGFADARDYYDRSSSAGFLHAIEVPTLLLHATDDPFLPHQAIPTRELEANQHLNLRLSPHGGHVGFLAGSPWAPRFWGEETAASFLAGRLRPRPAP
jgi:predicted alpha/beta-fold hydrolase